MSVIARIEPLVIPTYPVGEPEKNPVFFEKRVYQGSNGKVYPVPFIDKVYDEPEDVEYQSVLLENDQIRLVLLPEIGGRIFIGQDKTNNDYDFFYKQDVIKPALVGLAGPWISGGVEFNWPQHHRPGTFMPADVHIEEEEDGAKTVWMSEHDPLNRLKGMHGIRLRPGSSLIELRARLYNRTPYVQTFLWWANVAAEVHDQYQSFFPADVNYVADHAVRATSSFPVANNPYYGIDYQNLPGENDLGWYKNIPVPTSYMVCQTSFDFFGGYDFSKDGGFVHVANRHVAPGKKQWTWGNDEFGYAWDRELTDEGGPYVELMAGVYTDNQPDFTYLLPYETKTFSQFWWPIQNIGPVQQANEQAALACEVDGVIKLGLCVASPLQGDLTVSVGDQVLLQEKISLSPGESWQNAEARYDGNAPSEICVRVIDGAGEEVLSYRPVDTDSLTQDREQATEPPAPEDIDTNDELYFTGEHLEQYRHPTRDPELYWNEALKLDPGDARCHTALGKRALNRGEFTKAKEHFEQAVSRLTHRHPNPVTGEAHYHLGLTLRWIGDESGAYKNLYKATWNYEWRSAAYYQLATIDCCRSDWKQALKHLDESLDTNRKNNKATVLMAIVQSKLENNDKVQILLDGLLEGDALDFWALYVKSGTIPAASRNDAQTILDLVFDFTEAGFFQEAKELLEKHHAQEVDPVAVPNPLERTPMTHYTLHWLQSLLGEDPTPILGELSPDHFFPSRLQEMMILQGFVQQIGDANAAYALGNFLFDKRRHADAIEAWEAAGDTQIPQVHRNLGIAYWNHERDGSKAAACYRKAMKLDPSDARLISEYDQLSAKRGVGAEERLAFLEDNQQLALLRDDATVALAALYNDTGSAQKALDLISSRRFHPWEGGEGAVLKQFTRAHILLGGEALENGEAQGAYDHFTGAMKTPESLGEAYHPLQAKADVNYWIGRSLTALGRNEEAREHFQLSADESGDFEGMAVTEYSELTIYKTMALAELGDTDQAVTVLQAMKAYAAAEKNSPAKIDYFATSLPNLLVFDEDIEERKNADMDRLSNLAEQTLSKISSAV